MTKNGMTLLAFAASVLFSTSTMAADLKPVTIAVGTSALDVSYPMLTLAKTLGYWKDEGLEVSLEPVGASLQAVQQMVGGNATFAQVNASVVIQSNVTNKLPLRLVMNNSVTDWNVAVPADSAIKSAQDMKGKTIGVFSLATGGIPLLKSYLKQNGVDPDKDVSLIPLGLGAAPVQALRSGQVDGLLYWGSATARFENAGLELRKIAPAEWRALPDYSLSTLQSTIEKDPDLVVKIARGMAKAEVFAMANPECAVKLHWKNYPATKPTGADAETLMKWDLNNIGVAVTGFQDANKLNGGQYWGNVGVTGVANLQTFLSSTKVIEGELPAETYIAGIPDLAKKANDFDAAAIRATATACKFDL